MIARHRHNRDLGPLKQRRCPFGLNEQSIVGNITGDHEDIGLFLKRVELVAESALTGPQICKSLYAAIRTRST